MLEEGLIADPDEQREMRRLLRTKRWNPYCIRHSAITADSDFLPEYALKKKVRWSMNSKQGARYIKRTIGNDLKREILARNGIVTSDGAMQQKATVHTCSRCTLVNALDCKFCVKCSYPLTQKAFEEIKAKEMKSEIDALRESYERGISQVRGEMKDQLHLIVTALNNVDQENRNVVIKQLVQDGIFKGS